MSSRRTCPACHEGFVKGERCLVNFRTGSRMALVCGKCASKALKVVPDRTGDLEKCIYCETNDAVSCLACAMKNAAAGAKVNKEAIALAHEIIREDLEEDPDRVHDAEPGYQLAVLLVGEPVR